MTNMLRRYAKPLGMVLTTGLTLSAYSNRDALAASYAKRRVNIYRANREEEVKEIIQYHQNNGGGRTMRVLGSQQSLNHIATSPSTNNVGKDVNDAFLDLSKCNDVFVEPKNNTAHVSAGVTVGQLLTSLRAHGLTVAGLFPHCESMSVVGLVQTGSHGSGTHQGPWDEQVQELHIETPKLGSTGFNKWGNPTGLFNVRVALGYLGVITNMVMQCIPLQTLTETVEFTTFDKLMTSHDPNIQHNTHLTYLTFPYTEGVVVVGATPAAENAKLSSSKDRDKIVKALSVPPSSISELSPASAAKHNKEYLQKMRYYLRGRSKSFTALSDDILLSPRIDSHMITMEVCVPSTSNDAELLQQVKSFVEKKQMPAVGPIIQRWSTPSRSVLSPATVDLTENQNPPERFTWIGVTVPTEYWEMLRQCQDDDHMSDRVAMQDYGSQFVMEMRELTNNNSRVHWAYLDLPTETPLFDGLGHATGAAQAVQNRIESEYELNELHIFHSHFDPDDMLANDFCKAAFGGNSSNDWFTRFNEKK